MNADLSTLLFVGVGAILTGTVALVLLLRGDLLPASSLTGGGRWFLGAALGIGIIAFSIKLAIIITISSFPERTLSSLGTRADGTSRLLPATGLDGMPPFIAGKAGLDPSIWYALPDKAPEPPDNPTTPEKVALGERLFFDPTLSRDGTVACASCHDLMLKGGADGLPTSVGINGFTGSRNAPTVWNAAFQLVLFWDGRAHSLEEQAAGPPLNPGEMGMPTAAAVEERVRGNSAYAPLFERAFGPGTPITMDTITAAIAAYERTLITPDTPYDRFVRGEEAALAAPQKRGMWLFQSVGCVNCHSGPNFSGASVFGIVSPYRMFPAMENAYKARYRLAEDKGMAKPDAAVGIWRIPSLRNVALTAPYLHNGSVDDLREVVRIMASSQLNAVISNDGTRAQPPVWTPDAKNFDTFKRRILSEQEVDDIVAFLNALTSDRLRQRMPGNVPGK